MLILAVDSATPVAGVALVSEDRIFKEEFSNFKKTHSETLLPVIARILKECDCTVHDVDLLALTVGPGSFTGLRIGMAAVKGLSMASGKPVVGVSTLEVIAYNVMASNALVCPLMDARKQEVYCGFYDCSGTCPQALAEVMACSPAEAVAQAMRLIEEKDLDRIILPGEGYYTYRTFFDKEFGELLVPAPIHLAYPRAAATASLAFAKAQKGMYEDIFTLKPFYIRLSEAEYRMGKEAR